MSMICNHLFGYNYLAFSPRSGFNQKILILNFLENRVTLGKISALGRAASFDPPPMQIEKKYRLKIYIF